MAKYDITKALENRKAPVNNNDNVEKEYNMLFGLNDVANTNMTTKEIRIDRITYFKNDPFKPYTEEQLQELADSILENGLLEPVTVRPEPEGETGFFQILSGRHRVLAYKKNKLKTIPAFIRDVDDDTAIMIVTEANLKKRQKILPSEKGWAYRMQLEAIKRQGKRSDLEDDTTSVHNGQQVSRDIIAERNQVKSSEIQRYIRLTYLIIPLLDLIDNNKLPLLSGVDFSYLDKPSQLAVQSFFFEGNSGYKINTKLSALIRQEYEKKKAIDENTLKKLISANGRKPARSKPFTMNRKEFSGYDLPNDKELKRLFLEFLEIKFKRIET